MQVSYKMTYIESCRFLGN